MALVNPNIAMSYRAPEIQPQNMLADYAAIQQIKGAQTQQEVSRMQLEKMKRDDEDLRQIQAKAVAAGGPSDLNTIADAYIKSGNPKYVEFGTNLRMKLDEKANFARIMGGGQPPSAAPTAAPSEAYPGYNESIGMGAPVNALAPAAAPAVSANALAPSNVDAMRQKRDQLLALGTTQSIAAAKAIESDIALASREPVYHNVPGVGLVDPRTGRVVTPSVEKAAAPVKNIANINPNDFTPASIQQFSSSGNYADLVPRKAVGTGEGAIPKAPIGYRVTKSGDLEAIPGGPAAGKPMTDLQKQALKKDFANDTSKVKSAVSTADELEKLTDELVGNPDKQITPHPGLGGITGYSALLPSLPSGAAAKAEQKLDTFKGKIKALGRAIASQEGKLGNMAVQEWQMVSDAVQAINPRAGNLDMQMRDVVRQARDLARNMKDKFDLTYEDQNSLQVPTSTLGKPAAAAPAAGPNIDALLNKYK